MAIATTTALLIGGAVAAAGSIGTAAIQSKAAKKQGQALQSAADANSRTAAEQTAYERNRVLNQETQTNQISTFLEEVKAATLNVPTFADGYIDLQEKVFDAVEVVRTSKPVDGTFPEDVEKTIKEKEESALDLARGLGKKFNSQLDEFIKQQQTPQQEVVKVSNYSPKPDFLKSDNGTKNIGILLIGILVFYFLKRRK